MKQPRFSLATLIIGTAMVGVALAGTAMLVQMQRRYPGYEEIDAGWVLIVASIGSPIWLPIAFGAYAAGSRRLTFRLLICLTAAEMVSLFACIWLIKNLT
jgi:hypothetical protein